jgi:hypothetical protein
MKAGDVFRELTPISSLRRTEGECAVLGLLTQPREGVFCLEDCSHSIEIEMTKDTVSARGLFTENCIVLAEGEMVGDKYRVSVLAMPPVEERSETCKRFPNLSFIGNGDGSKSQDDHIDAKISIIVLSDVWLDRPKVQTGLKQLFNKYNSVCQKTDEINREQYIFVLMGNFTSQPAPIGYDLHRALFDQVQLFHCICCYRFILRIILPCLSSAWAIAAEISGLTGMFQLCLGSWAHRYNGWERKAAASGPAPRDCHS